MKKKEKNFQNNIEEKFEVINKINRYLEVRNKIGRLEFLINFLERKILKLTVYLPRSLEAKEQFNYCSNLNFPPCNYIYTISI